MFEKRNREFRDLRSNLRMPDILDVPSDPASTNKLLAQLMRMFKISMASQDVGVDWDTYQVWVEPGSQSTEIVKVSGGDLVMAKLVNLDSQGARTLFVEKARSVRAPGDYGIRFADRIIIATNQFIDFTEDGGITPLAATVANATYTSGAAFAAAIQAAMNAVIGIVATYTVRWLTSKRSISITSDGAGGATLDILWATGANAANSIGATAGFDVSADDTGALSYTADNPIVGTVSEGDLILTGQPIYAGDEATFLLDQSLFGILESDAALRVPVQVKRARIETELR